MNLQSSHPHLLVTMCFAVLVAGGTARAEDLATTVGRYETWRGGEAFVGMRTLHSKGTLSSSGLTGTVETWWADGKRLRQEVDLGAFAQKTIVAGDRGWATNMSGQVAKLSPSDLADTLRDGLLLLDGVLHGQDGAQLRLQPQETCAGVACDVLRLSFGDDSTYDYLLVHSDGRLIAIRSRVKNRSRVTAFDDWRVVGGVRIPFHEAVTGESPSDAASTTYRSVEVDPRLTADLFAEPEGSRRVVFERGGASSGWLNFELFDRTRLFIPAQINGHAATVLLDSGATSTVLDGKFAQANGLKVEGELTAEGTGGTSTAGVVRGVDIKLGALSLRDVTAVAIDAAPIERQLGHAAPVFLGAEIFQDCAVDIDFPNRRIAFRDPATMRIPRGARVIPTVMENGQQVLEASLEGRPARLLFDLGSGSALSLFPRFWDQPEFLANRRTSTTLSGGFGGMNIEKLAMADGLKIGGVVLPRVPVKLSGKESSDARAGRLDGNIGMPVFSRFHLVVDRPHERILIVPPLDVETHFDIDRTGLTFRPSAAGFAVLHVAPGSPGEKAGLKVGDEIAAVDGASRTADWRFGPPGRTLRLELSNGQHRELTLADYF